MPPLPPGAAGSARVTLALVTGVVMIGLGLFVALRPLWADAAPLAGNVWLDYAFAAFFLLRGGMNVRAALAARGRASAGPPSDRG